MHAINENLLSSVLGRDESLFRTAIKTSHDELREAIAGRRILVIGAGGSIGSAFVKVLVAFHPGALYLVDLSENSLARIIRELHAGGSRIPPEFASLAVGFDEIEFDHFVRDRADFDYVLNFAALKHVRSERDPYTAMRLLRVNVLANHALLQILRDRPLRNFFCVSSDKAVNPASLMGASKAFMERVCLAAAKETPFSSARFANVAFSDGSLLQSFEERIAARQPLAGPSDVRRYFISHQEAGELCLLAGFLGRNREILTPTMNGDEHLKAFPELAALILQHHGLRPLFCGSEEEAIVRARQGPLSAGEWPCFFSPSNTPGEKPYEEFVQSGEAIDCERFASVTAVTEPRCTSDGLIADAIAALQSIRRGDRWDVSRLIDIVTTVVPEFQHVYGTIQLDHKL